MAVSNSNKNEKRAIFPKGEQIDFLQMARKRLGLSWSGFAERFGLNIRTLTDWKREKYSLPMAVLKQICTDARMKIPDEIELKNVFWYVDKGARVGGIAMYKKYGRVGGDPEYRKKRWREWWKKEGRFRKDLITSVTKPIKRPSFSLKLAEFIGIILGDGGISNYQVTVTLNSHDDIEYADYVKSLFFELFGVVPAMHIRQKAASVVSIVVSRIELVKFLISIGLKVGGKVKHQVGVPRWIDTFDVYSKMCLRGLFDTDGSFYVDKHKGKDKTYFNAGMAFTNRSLPILNFFKRTLEELGFSPTKKTDFVVFLRREEEIIRYFDEIGSSNQKHINKYKNYLRVVRGGVG